MQKLNSVVRAKLSDQATKLYSLSLWVNGHTEHTEGADSPPVFTLKLITFPGTQKEWRGKNGRKEFPSLFEKQA